MSRVRVGRAVLAVVLLGVLGGLVAVGAGVTDAASYGSALPRATGDRVDDVTGSQVHVIYVLPSDGPDRALDTNGTLTNTVSSIQTWLSRQTGGRPLRFDTYQGSLDISFLRLSRTEADIESENAFVRDAIEDETRAAGFNAPNKIYAVYYDGTSNWSCGGGAWPPDLPGNVAALYLDGLPSQQNRCSSNQFAAAGGVPTYWEFALLHEILHTLGFVAQCAPNHTLRGHTSENMNDVMWAGTSGYWFPDGYANAVLDSGNNDYYNHANAGCPDFDDSPFLDRNNAGWVSGTVTGTGSGSPIAGAWVALLRTADFSIAAGAVANANGDYSAAVAPGTYYLYLVDPTGAHTARFFGPPTTVTVNAGAMTDVDPQMAATRGSVAGTVTEAGSGAPIGGAWVIGINATTGATQRGAVADGAGLYTIAGLAAGSYRPVFVDPTGAHASRYYPNSVDFLGATSLTVTAGASTAANVALPTQSTTPGAQTLSGTVREAGTNTPLGGVFVVALRASDFRNAGGAVTNGSGQYSLNVAAGDYKLAFVDSTGGHNMEWHDNQPNTGLATATSVTAPAVTNAALDANTGSMTGTITDDASGAPLVGAWVVGIGPTGAIAGCAVTAANGTYTIAGLAPGTYRATIVDPNGGRTQEYFNNSPDYAGATPFNITAGATATINAALALP